MANRKLYLYNPETDNFERFYPSLKDRIVKISVVVLISLALATGFYLLILFLFETPTVENLTEENTRLKKDLKSQYEMFNQRVNYTLDVMNAIQERDSNIYRVIMQMDSVNPSMIISPKLRAERARIISKTGDSRLLEALMNQLDSLDLMLLRQSFSFSDLVKAAQINRDKIAHTPAVLPIHIRDYTVSSGYGKRIDPIYDVPKFHAGLDFAADVGTPVYATADGVVEVADNHNEYGNHVDIDHGYDYMSRYAHLSKIMVKPGQKIKRGDLVGLVGSTGKSTGPHLHYEVRFKGEPQNPVDYYFMDLSPEEYDQMIKLASTAGHVMD